ncbi:MAG: hypothetical protein KA735_01930 [Burkholderiaceae bacterium]|nr:hypothetical protein [Burkholderiaceae bacterium]
MKASIVLVSVLIGVATWWWHNLPRNSAGKATTRRRLHTAFKSIVAGVVAYFVLMAIAMLYLLVTTA